ncbi:MAG: S41 family peptidase [Lachnospiraceae bacterium]|nr:S41 family peptidase [Lachnospiraceae bacterium]
MKTEGISIRQHLITALMAVFIPLFLTGCVVYYPAQPQDAGNAVKEAEPQSTGYTEKEVKLFAATEEESGEILLRFYEEMPSVPFIGLKQYKQIVDHEEITVSESDGCVILTSEDGSSVAADPVAGTLTSESFAQFRNNERDMIAGKMTGFNDVVTPFVRIESVEYEPVTEPTVIDLSAYNIPLYTDEDDVYMPLATATDLMIDAAFNALQYDGENVCLRRGYFEKVQSMDPDYYKKIIEKIPRKKDMIDYAYNELCFVMDRLYACPGRAFMDGVLAEKGLDRALEETDEITAKVKELLLSEDQDEYIAGLMILQYYFFDKHTYLFDNDMIYAMIDAEVSGECMDIAGEISDELSQKEYYESIQDAGYYNYELADVREQIFGDTDTYHEKGDTAVITMDDFISFDEEGWKAYYEGKGDIPDVEKTGDIVAALLSDLNKANEDPDIKNVIIDLTNNGGGANNIMAFFIALLTGKSELHCYDRVTKQPYTIRYIADTLLDGSFDTSAVFESLDLNLAIMTTGNSFSCGNAAPAICKDAGIPIIGETSGGGTCMVIPLILPEGEVCQISAGFAIMVNEAGEDVEDGIPVDADLVYYSEEGEKDYSDLYDLDVLSDVMKELYESKAAA